MSIGRSALTDRLKTAYAHLDRERLLDVFAKGPERLQRVVGDLAPDHLTARPMAGKWSVLEIVLHVADSELVGATRMRMVLGGDAPELPGYDQDRWARAFAYQDRGPGAMTAALAMFAALRHTTLALLASLPEADWQRTGRHPEHGSMTVRNLLELYADHSERHIEQVLERRRLLGIPTELDLLLPERLY